MRASLLLVALAAACGTGDVRPLDSTDPSSTTVPAVAVPVVASVSAATLPCLRPDSLAPPHDTLRFTSLRIHEETGDLLGTDLFLGSGSSGWGGRIALAEGSLSPYSPLRNARIEAATSALAFEFDFDGRPANFLGKIACGSVTGDFRWGPDAEPEADTLNREPRLR